MSSLTRIAARFLRTPTTRILTSSTNSSSIKYISPVSFKIIRDDHSSSHFSRVMSVQYCTGSKPIEIASYDEVKKISLEDKPEILLIDVREPDELKATGQIRNSINIPLGKVQEILSDQTADQVFQKLYNREKPSLDEPIVFFCKIGKRSQSASERAKQLGFKNVKNYKGSYTDWCQRENLPAP